MSYYYDDTPTLSRFEQHGRGMSVGGMLMVAVVMLVGGIAFFSWLDMSRASEASQVEKIDLAPTANMYAAAPLPTEEALDPEAEARARQLALVPTVRKQLCQGYAARYNGAKTPVELAKAIHLSQAASCGWSEILHADAKTHELSPEALEVALGMDAEDVPTMGSTLADQAEMIDSMDSKLTAMKDDVEAIRRRMR
jgi:hypothetical protein